MADFRKWLLAFAVVALLLGAGTANAQPGLQQAGFTCTANAGTPVIVRVEGITELVGDLLLQCVGGQPTPKGILTGTWRSIRTGAARSSLKMRYTTTDSFRQV